MFHQPDVAWFYALPATMQDLWIEHVRNRLTGAYEVTRKPVKRSHADNLRTEEEGIRKARRAGAAGR